MSIKLRCVFSALLLGALSTSSMGQVAADPRGDLPPSAPGWTDIVALKAVQSGSFLTLIMELADSIPKSAPDSCIFQFLLDTDADGATGFRHGTLGVDHVIEFEHSNWDGAPWYAMFLNGRLAAAHWPGERHRMFDWKLGATTLTVRFSLTALGWSSVKMKARVFYRDQFTDFAPDAGHVAVEVNTERLTEPMSAASRRTKFIYPAEFKPVLAQNHIPHVLDAAYELQNDLTGIKPVGGDTLRFVFHPLYGGAAIEGDPIYIGPAMWGRIPLWFVYFHEMGHNFCNASTRFRQLYPLQFSVPPGPLPANILFYEAFASLPAMYVYDRIEQEPGLLETDTAVVRGICDDWQMIRARFAKTWSAYKASPSFLLLNPDIIAGLLLELKDEYGWGMFKDFYRLLRPVDQDLPIFDIRLPDDTPDLQRTRATLTVAALSAAAGEDLRERFEAWGFPINGQLFDVALSTLVPLLKAARDTHK